MKLSGILMIVIAVVWALLAFNMDVSVTTEAKTIGNADYSVQVPSMTVNNIGLMDQRRNHLMGAGVVFIAGVVLLGLGSIGVSSNLQPSASLIDDSPIGEVVDLVPLAVVAEGDDAVCDNPTFTYCKKCTGMNNCKAIACFRCGAALDAV